MQPPRVQVHVSISDDNDTALNLPLGEMATADSVTTTQLQVKSDDDWNNPDEDQEVDEAKLADEDGSAQPAVANRLGALQPEEELSHKESIPHVRSCEQEGCTVAPASQEQAQLRVGRVAGNARHSFL